MHSFILSFTFKLLSMCFLYIQKEIHGTHTCHNSFLLQNSTRSSRNFCLPITSYFLRLDMKYAFFHRN
ncbi:hypothetical protein PRUPE_1G417500 [Prunus persica]|uniref:Uncharacterized protein n=1 Tax=Prunus persica TaxID=3760 RepID=M5XF30_PRUPE|nr:hypothetical protein PRUPE_1G417500 [Prunus persica]